MRLWRNSVRRLMQPISDAVREQVVRRYNGEDQNEACLIALADYILATASELDKTPAERIFKGMIAYPDAEAYL